MEFFKANFYWILWTSGILFLLIFYIYHEKKIRTFLLGASTGLTALVLLHFYGEAIGFAPTLCITNLLICGLFGVPGMALILLGQAFV